jgi:hypothetical protein
MAGLVKDQLVVDLARESVAQVAPQELPLYRATSELYLRNPDRLLQAQKGRDEPLGFGVDAGVVLLTPVIITVTKEVVEFVAAEVMKSVRTESSNLISEFVKKMFKRFRREGEARGEELPPPLTPEQLRSVRELALEKARQLQLSPSRAELLADSLVGNLAVPE